MSKVGQNNRRPEEKKSKDEPEYRNSKLWVHKSVEVDTEDQIYDG